MKKSKQKVETVAKTSSFSDSTYSLAKALHFIDLARQYFEDAQFGTEKDVKIIFNQYINKCNWIILDLKSRLSNENREILAKELEQSLDINAIMDKVIHLDNKQKAFIEDIIDSMRKGEEVIIVDDKKDLPCQE
jgi:flagellin-specific chaperone FliS